MKIIAGSRRGHRLRVPEGIRPSGGRLREGLFSILAGAVDDCSFLDLFAGSGAVGLEAISRGARAAVFVDQGGRGLPALRDNVERLGEGRGRVIVGKMPGVIGRRLAGERFDVVFVDPPYAWRQWDSVIDAIIPVLAPTALVALEHSSRIELPKDMQGLELYVQRTYGESSLALLELTARET